jgi:uncharacterized protein YcbK (DUF882 family)
LQRKGNFGTASALPGFVARQGGEAMIPLLSIALTLISNATDLAHMFVADKLDDRPAGITFYFENRHEQESFVLVDETGDAKLDVVKQFSHFVRCWRTGREKLIHPRTVEIITAIAQHFDAPRIDVVSGYRARPYGAPHSKHFLGRAMDIHVPNVPAKQVAKWVWENFRHVGVGYYPKQQFVHVDTRDMDVRWIDVATHGESAHARYFGRPAGEELPADAPRLAYDQPKLDAAPATAVATASHSVQMVALDNILQGSFDPLQF